MTQFKERDVQLGPATPEQAEAAAPLMYDTDPALLGYMYSDGYEAALQFFAIEWRQERSLMSFSHCTAAVSGDSLLGIELGYDRKTQEELMSKTGVNGAASLTGEGLGRLLEVVGYLPYLMPPIGEESYYVWFLSIHPSARGQGLGSRLLNNAFEEARMQDKRLCELDVASDSRAVAFYERMGMKVLSEARVLPMERHGVAPHYRMVKDLT